MTIGGMWYNELGSEIMLSVDGIAVTGTYQTAVGNAQGIYQLVGGVDTEPSNQGQAIGFAVAWVNAYGSANSVTTWSGQWQLVDGEETITTMWLLTTETDTPFDWNATLVGKDVFTRYQPAPAQIAQRSKSIAWSHPRTFKTK